MIYPLRKVNLIKFMQNEPISIRNIREIHENANLIEFLNQLAGLTLFSQNFKNFNRLVNPLTRMFPNCNLQYIIKI